MSRRGGVLPWLLAALLLVLGFIGWRLTTRPVLVLSNALVLPARVTVNAEEPRVVPPGGVAEFPVPRGALVTLEWQMERPVTRGGVPVGAGLGETVMLPEPNGRTTHVLRAMRGDTAFFAPLITNATGRPLAVRINAGLAGAEDCPCEVPPAARRMTVGYYRLYRNSTVEVRDSAGRTARFPDLGPQTEPASGVVGLRFDAADLR